MYGAGVIAALQAAVPEAGTSVAPVGISVLILAALLAAAISGWVVHALSRRRHVLPPPGLAARPADRLEESFLASESGLADAVLMFRDGRIARAGAGAGALFGTEVGDLHDLRLTDLATAEEVLPLAEALRRLEEQSLAAAEARFRVRRPRGASGPDVAARILRPQGSPAGCYVVALTDISEAAAAARSAAAMASRIDAALSVLKEGVLVTSGEGGRQVVLLANRGVEEIFGLPSGSALGRPLADLRARLAVSFTERTLDGFFPQTDAPHTDVIEAGGDPPRHIERTVRPLGGAPGSHGFLYTFRDLTHERGREEELRRVAQEATGAREGLEALHRDLQMANEGLERRMTELGRFNRDLRALDEMKSNLLANVSHELQTPLVSIKGYTEMILKGRMGPLTEEQDRGLRVALRNIDRLISLIDSLLTFARAEEEAARLRIQSFPLRPLVEEVIDLLRDGAAAKKVRVTAAFPMGGLTIRGDRDRILQVFINIVSNAIKYNNEGGSVIIEATRGRRSLARVEVRDTGVGISREDLDRIFDRFYRGPGAAGEGEGSGLGLAITKDILRLHGCMIRADSEPGKGSAFSFTLPLEPRGRGEKHPRVHGAAREEP